MSSINILKEISAGGVVFKKLKTQNSNGKTFWLVTKSSPSELYPKSYWRLPKGWLDDEDGGKEPGLLARGERKATEEELQKAAIREVREEAGVGVKVLEKIGSEKYFFTSNGKRIFKFVTFYLMKWREDLPGGTGFETSEIGWFSFEEARKRLRHSGERKILDEAMKLLEQGTQESLV